MIGIYAKFAAAVLRLLAMRYLTHQHTHTKVIDRDTKTRKIHHTHTNILHPPAS